MSASEITFRIEEIYEGKPTWVFQIYVLEVDVKTSKGIERTRYAFETTDEIDEAFMEQFAYLRDRLPNWEELDERYKNVPGLPA